MIRPVRVTLALALMSALGLVIWVNRSGDLPRGSESGPYPPAEHDHQHGLGEARPSPASSAELRRIEAFRIWLADFRAGEDSDAFIASGVAIAKERRVLMVEWLRNKPSAALDASIGYADYARLPEALRGLVERPFTERGDLEVVAICDSDHRTPELDVGVYLSDGLRLQTASKGEMRVASSKSGIPMQGVELGGWTAIRPPVFQPLQEADLSWALDTLPTGNPDPSLDFLTGEPLGAEPVVAVAGGRVFKFSSPLTLAEMEKVLQEFDSMPGGQNGSSVIFSDEVQLVQANGFPIEAVRTSQAQILSESTTGGKTALFIRLAFTDKTDTPLSKQDLESQINGAVSRYLSEFSYHQTSMTATATTKAYQLAKPSSGYPKNPPAQGDMDSDTLWNEAVAAYEADGSPQGSRASFDIVGVIFPEVDGVFWSGLGSVGGANPRLWINGVPRTETIVHEFGHNYGLLHANYWEYDKTNPNSRNPVDPIGDNSDEYGDIWDVMGSGSASVGHFHMGAKRYIGWLASDQIASITGAAGSGTYRVNRFDHPDATGLQGLEIKKSANENYWVGLRRGYESTANYYQGAYILWERAAGFGGDHNQGWVIDTTPGSDSERQDAGISLGRTYSDAAAGVHITPIAVGGSGANEYLDVVVNVGDFAGNLAPTLSFAPPASGEARKPLELSAAGSDGDGGDTLVYSWDLGDGTVYPSTSSITAYYTVGGTYTINVTVSDMKGGTSTRSGQITISDPVNTWNTRFSGNSRDLKALAANDDSVVAAGDEGIFLRSAEGVTWTDHSLPDGNATRNVTIEAMTWTGSEFVAVGRNYDFGVRGWKPVVFTSPDGRAWTSAFSGPVLPGSLIIRFWDVASNADGSKVVAVGDGGMVYRRLDGGSWEKVELGLADTARLRGVSFGSGSFLIGGYDEKNDPTDFDRLLLFSSTDANNWSDLKAGSTLNFSYGLAEIEFLDGFFVGGGIFSGTIFSENGGLTWQTLIASSDVLEAKALAFGNGVYYALGDQYAAPTANQTTPINLVSNNGKNWSEVESSLIEEGNDIIFFKDRFIVVGDARVLPDGEVDPDVSPGSPVSWIRQSDLIEAADSATPLSAPELTPKSKEFFHSLDVAIAPVPSGVSVRYTLDGSEPTVVSALYAETLTLLDTTTVKAKSFKDGASPSSTVAETYTKILTSYDNWIDGFALDAADRLPNANPDGDWATNLIEWALNSDPSDRFGIPARPELRLTDEGKWRYTVYRNSPTPSEAALSVESSANLKDWVRWVSAVTSDSDFVFELTSEGAASYPFFVRIKVSPSY